MNRAGIFFYKGFCIALCTLLFFGAWGMIDKGRYYDAGFGSGTLLLTSYLFNKPSIRNFGTIIAVFAIAMFFVGTYDNIDL